MADDFIDFILRFGFSGSKNQAKKEQFEKIRCREIAENPELDISDPAISEQLQDIKEKLPMLGN